MARSHTPQSQRDRRIRDRDEQIRIHLERASTDLEAVKHLLRKNEFADLHRRLNIMTRNLAGFHRLFGGIKHD